MGARESMGTNLSQGLVARVVSGIKYAVTGVGPMNFFGPMQPLQPVAQTQTEGRAMDYPVGYNLRQQPREGEQFSFATLRGLADGYDLLRIIIETRKDQIEAFDFEIAAFDANDSNDYTADVTTVMRYLESPDKEHDWPQWMRMLIEDLLVIDAVVLYPRKTKGGQPYALEVVDPATIKRVIDDTGRTPMPPDVAYQQVLKGIGTADYSADTLIYTMRNGRSNRIYGYSPVEQVMMTVNIAMRRQLSQLDYYTQGNIPEALAQAPSDWTAKQIQEFQIWWDSVLEGNSAEKRKMRFLPNLDKIEFTKREILKDEYDEWLARIICFAFSIPPSALIKQVNRASGQQMADTAKEEGLMPLLRFFESFMTRLVRRHLGFPKLKFQFKIVNRVDPTQQASIHKIYNDIEVMTPDEIREELDMDALTPAEREAAWPTPIPPGMNPDGTPITPLGAAGAAKPAPAAGGAPGGPPAAGGAKPPVKPDPTPAEKMLARALEMLDPAAIAKVAQAMAPNVVHVAGPEVTVGDVNVHVPGGRKKETA